VGKHPIVVLVIGSLMGRPIVVRLGVLHLVPFRVQMILTHTFIDADSFIQVGRAPSLHVLHAVACSQSVLVFFFVVGDLRAGSRLP